MVKTGKNRPGKNRFWTGFFHIGGKNTLADRVVVATRDRKNTNLTCYKAVDAYMESQTSSGSELLTSLVHYSLDE